MWHAPTSLPLSSSPFALVVIAVFVITVVVVVEELVVVVSKMKKKTNAKTITTTPGKQSILTHLLSFGLVWLSSVVVFVVARLLASHCVFVSISTFCCYFPLNGCWLFGLLNGATCDRQIDRPTKRPIDRSSNRTSDLTTDRPLLPMLCCFCCYWPLVTAAQ